MLRSRCAVGTRPRLKRPPPAPTARAGLRSRIHAIHARRCSSAGSGGPRPAPRRDGRWIYLEGWSEDDRFCLGGELLVNSDQINEVRLALADGTVLVDDVVGGVVLFLDDRPLRHPVLVRVYDGRGAMLASHPAF